MNEASAKLCDSSESARAPAATLLGAMLPVRHPGPPLSVSQQLTVQVLWSMQLHEPPLELVLPQVPCLLVACAAKAMSSTWCCVRAHLSQHFEEASCFREPDSLGGTLVVGVATPGVSAAGSVMVKARVWTAPLVPPSSSKASVTKK